jgi:hypothetical protein
MKEGQKNHLIMTQQFWLHFIRQIKYTKIKLSPRNIAENLEFLGIF